MNRKNQVFHHCKDFYFLPPNCVSILLPCIFEAFGASIPNGVSALLDCLSARCKHRPPPDATRYAPCFKTCAYQRIASALWLFNARNCLRLAGLIRSNFYAVFDNPA